jgi:hypothetical protein
MKYKSSREIMKAINDGDIPRQHLGPKNFYILKQELFSLYNEYKPDVFTQLEIDNWNKKLAERLEEIKYLSESEQKELYTKVDEMLDV